MSEADTAFDAWFAGDPTSDAADGTRSISLTAPDATTTAAALAALANTRGGDALLHPEAGVGGKGEAGDSATAIEQRLALALTLIDPPIDHLVRHRALLTDGGPLVQARVRMSPSSPHVVTATGLIPKLEDGALRPVRSRRELDDLYARGRGERERADRLVDAMIEKLTLSHYAFYNLALVACTHLPSAEPYSAAATALIAPGDAFIEAFKLHEEEVAVRTGEVELRTPGDVGAYIRVTRAGCVAAGEIQRRPYHDELDSLEGLRARIERTAATVCRLLAPSGDSVMLPHLFVEGVRGLRLLEFAQGNRRRTTNLAPQDTSRYALALGDPKDPAYPARLAAEAMTRLEALFPPSGE